MICVKILPSFQGLTGTPDCADFSSGISVIVAPVNNTRVTVGAPLFLLLHSRDAAQQCQAAARHDAFRDGRLGAADRPSSASLRDFISDAGALTVELMAQTATLVDDVVRQARAISSATPVVFTAVDSAAEWACQGVPNSFLLKKPFSRRTVDNSACGPSRGCAIGKDARTRFPAGHCYAL